MKSRLLRDNDLARLQFEPTKGENRCAGNEFVRIYEQRWSYFFGVQ
jgi:hypothetical protein